MLYKVYQLRLYLYDIELTLNCLNNVGELGIKHVVSFTELFLYSIFVYKKDQDQSNVQLLGQYYLINTNNGLDESLLYRRL